MGEFEDGREGRKVHLYSPLWHVVDFRRREPAVNQQRP